MLERWGEEIIMDRLAFQQARREADKAQAHREELAARIGNVMREDGTVEPLPGLTLHRASTPKEPLHSVYTPVFCVIAQGSKEVFLGDERYVYNSDHYLIVTAQLPVVSHVFEASKECPYLSFRLDLDPTLVTSVMVEVEQSSPRSRADVRAVNVSPIQSNLLDAVVRMVRLLDSPTEAHFLMPLISREIVYRLLTGKQGDRLRHVAAQNGNSHCIVMAIERLRKEFDQPLRIEELARNLGMSVSGFHHHFKMVTAMSPLQFQKRLRLQEARRLMLGEQLDATSAAYRVGYDDASHFSREYKRLFGAPPMRDIERLREPMRKHVGV
jgi:AraC-like DNA-binding protein